LGSLDTGAAENEDQKTGMEHPQSTGRALRLIVSNAGGEGSTVAQKIRDGKDDYGYNGRTGEYANS